MTRFPRWLPALAAPLLAACAATPPAPPAAPGPALVVGTFSYQYVNAADAPQWRVHLERLDQPADYTLAANLDPQRQHGVFTGALPPGVYAFRDAGGPEGRYEASGMAMPFTVEAGEVRDLGHYALNPLTPR
ncbi:MAG TPA: hypothetical protein VM369_10960 [Candidatus Binatia bacterium]|nr:hypothetical protein [Candidatus Binatia bacterium]